MMFQILQRNVTPILVDDCIIKKARGCKPKPKRKDNGKKIDHVKRVYFRSSMIKQYKAFSDAVFKQGFTYKAALETCSSRTAYARDKFVEHMKSYNRVVKSDLVEGYKAYPMPKSSILRDATQDIPNIMRCKELIDEGFSKVKAYEQLAMWLKCCPATAGAIYRKWAKGQKK